jgi:hypothetical protein
MTEERLRLEYVPLATVALWDKNPKRHDVGGIIEAIQTYGFKDPPKYEPALNEGKGGIVAGNGRIICLQMMKAEGMPRPRGIDETADDWAVPVVFGVDAESEAAAEAYAVDHNNLTMAGGDYDGLEMAKIVTVDADVIDMLKPWAEPPKLDDLASMYGDPNPEDFWPIIRIKVRPETYQQYKALLSGLNGDEAENFATLLSAVDASLLE